MARPLCSRASRMRTSCGVKSIPALSASHARPSTAVNETDSRCASGTSSTSRVLGGAAKKLPAAANGVRAQPNSGGFETAVVQDLEASVRDAPMRGDQHDIREALRAAPDDLKIRNDLLFRIRRLLGRLQTDHLVELTRIGGGKLEVTNGHQIPRNRDEDGVRGH